MVVNGFVEQQPGEFLGKGATQQAETRAWEDAGLAGHGPLATLPYPGARPRSDPEWAFVLSAGERRAFTANPIIRDPAWRRRDPTGTLRMNDDDAARLGLAAGDCAHLTTRRAATEVTVEPTDRCAPDTCPCPTATD
ncbi:molybdopterin dinucleotide binding domain-containing protein [Actinomadura sp. 3N407]|uniref:molybdopterin dinucleotide binding domain-containing protein n=1 Tax=Actinomadura sp. 3N407 TaxID=3457423 RepID=UPI003FCEBB9B